MGAHPGDHDPPEGVAGLAVTAGIEAVAGDFPRRCLERGGRAQVRPGGLAAQPLRVVPGRDQEQGGGVGADPVQGEQAGGRAATSGVMSSPGRSSCPPGNSARRPSSRSAMRVA